MNKENKIKNKKIEEKINKKESMKEEELKPNKKIEEKVENTEEKNDQQKQNATNSRQIIIETDGNNIRIVKAEVLGTIELVAIMQRVIDNFTK